MTMKQKELKIKWPALKAVIFDVDGTLYDQCALRRRMFLDLARYYFVHPRRLKDLRILMDFRNEREKNAFRDTVDLESDQYIWGAQASGVSPERVRSVVQKWILKVPLQYIAYYRYPGLLEFFNNLNRRGIKTAIFSDYPAAEKIAALGIPNCFTFCATDKNINRLKPDPKGLFVIAKTLGGSVKQCLFIGDRDDRDGGCARRAGMEYLIIERECSGIDNHFQAYQQLNDSLKES